MENSQKVINCNPIFKNEYQRKNISVVFSDDMKTATISNIEGYIVVDGSFFKDVVKVIDRAIEDIGNDGDHGNQRAGELLWNTMSTSLSLPYDKDEFND